MEPVTGPVLRRLRVVRRWPMRLVLALLAGCGGEGADGTDGPRCRPVAGAWTVVSQAQDGGQVTQQWTLRQSGCDLAAEATAPVPEGPWLDRAADGGISGDDFWLNWAHPTADCLYRSGLAGRFDGPAGQDATALTGTLTWTRIASTPGGCAAASGRYTVAGTR